MVAFTRIATLAAIVIALAIAGPVLVDVIVHGEGRVRAASAALDDAIVCERVERVGEVFSPRVTRAMFADPNWRELLTECSVDYPPDRHLEP